ncbi:MAG TPA: hypothetical protein VFV38_44500 [Ktedonobacteraceae bacterium]|nr:hypothetical protein [Ktedonobacteraceae bacterium]
MGMKCLVKRLAHVFVMVAMLTILFGMGTTLAHAQRINSRQSALPSITGCTSSNGASITYCNAPQVSITCGGNIASATDGNGVAINWTFNTLQGGPVCVTTTYTMNYSDGRTTCSFLFYVPNGDATADIIFHYRDSSGTFTYTLNEDPVSGWQTILGGDRTDVTSLFFTDVNDQATNTKQIGWGKTASFGLKRVCA